MTPVRTSPFYPQSKGKRERWHQSLKTEAVRPKNPLSLEAAQRLVGESVTPYNTGWLNSAIGYLTPKDKLDGRVELILAERERKLAAAHEVRRQRRAAQPGNSPEPSSSSPLTTVPEKAP